MTDLELAHHYALALLCKQAREMEYVYDNLEALLDGSRGDNADLASLRKILDKIPNFRKVSKP